MIIFVTCILGACFLVSLTFIGYLGKGKLKSGKEIKRLNIENEKLAILNVDLDEEINSLEGRVKLLPPGQRPKRSKVDLLIDEIENSMEITNISCISYSEEYDKRFIGTKPVVVAEFNGGAVKIIDLAQTRDGKTWTTDLLYHDVIFPRINERQTNRLKAILTEKMAVAAAKDANIKI